jgi:hypothetical protein
MSSPVTEQRPPAFLAPVVNRTMAWLVSSRAGRRIKGLGLLEFEGRRTGKVVRVVVGIHDVAGTSCVFTPAAWRANFTDGHPVKVTHLGRTNARTGTLETDPPTVAAAIATVLAAGTAPRALALRMPDHHIVTAADVETVNRAMIRLT